jgi:hypothetical protein
VELLDLVGQAASFLQGTPWTDEEWAQSEEAFEDHFGRNYDDFSENLAALDREEVVLYGKTLEVNPEAAVLWILTRPM